MSFILRSHQDRYRQRARENFYRGVSVFAFVAGAIAIGYFAGQKKNEQEGRFYYQKKQELESQFIKAEDEVSRLRANYQTLRLQYEQLQADYKRHVPQGDFNVLINMVREQLDKGLTIERMAQIIRSAQPPQNCTPAITKRFIVSTSAYKGPESVITFADGAITVKGTGDASINSKGVNEAWFDPGKPVKLSFTIIGGRKEVKEGLLPFHHTIILRNKEHRFTISQGPQSFIVITGDYCDYQESPTMSFKTSAAVFSASGSM
jgi:hypothetical protein